MAKKVNKEETVAKKTTAKKADTTKKTATKAVEKKTTETKTKASKEVKKKTSNKAKVESKKVSSSTKDETKKPVTKKASKTTKKKATKKVDDKQEEVSSTPVEETNKGFESKKEDIVEETAEVKEDADVANTTEETKVEEAKPVETVPLNSTTAVAGEKPKKKKNIFLRVILAIVIIACAVAVAIMCLANNISAIEEHFDPIDIYKDQLVVSDEDKDKSKEVLLAINLLNNITIDENTYDATLAVSKPVVYNFFDIDTLNNIDFLKLNGFVVNQFGYDLDPENSIINVYAAVKYNNFLNMGITAQLTYEFTDTDLVIKFKDAQIGNLPAFLYKDKIPESGKELFRQNISDFNVVNDIKVRFLDPQKIKDIKYEDNTVYISLNIEEAVNDIINELFDTSNGDSKFAQIANYYLKQLFNDSTDVDYTSMIDSVSTWVQSVIGDVDLDSIGNLIGIFAQ